MIRTKRLDLVPFEIKYAKDLLELWGDKEVIDYTYMPLLYNISECEEKINMFIQYTDKELINNFIILLEEKAIGIIGFPIENKDEKRFGFYYQLAKRYWANGYMMEAAYAAIEYIRKEVSEGIIFAEAVDINKGSIRILENLGFAKTETIKNGFQCNGNTLDLGKYCMKRL